MVIHLAKGLFKHDRTDWKVICSHFGRGRKKKVIKPAVEDWSDVGPLFAAMHKEGGV